MLSAAPSFFTLALACSLACSDDHSDNAAIPDTAGLEAAEASATMPRASREVAAAKQSFLALLLLDPSVRAAGAD